MLAYVPFHQFQRDIGARWRIEDLKARYRVSHRTAIQSLNATRIGLSYLLSDRRSRSFKTRRRIFPAGLFGISLTNSTRRIRL